MFNYLLKIFSSKRNIFLLIFLGILTFVLLRIFAQGHIILESLVSPVISLERKSEILYQYTFGAFSSHSIFNYFFTALFSLAFSMNSIIFSYYWKYQRRIIGKEKFLTVSGVILGIFGVGCASCGALVIAPLLSILGIAGIINFLPFGGQEFLFVGVACMFISIYYLLCQLKKPLVCN